MAETYITTIQLYIGMVIFGLLNGLGNAIGSYLANKHVIKKINGLKRKLAKKT
jgi:hypothetical protein